jgi:branched-chain amino acid transport system ATP-binding protein
VSALLSVAGATSGYGVLPVIRDLSFEVHDGTVVTVLGPNGAGKSTLARTLSGLLPLRQGTVRVDGADLSKASASQWRRAGIIHLPEGRGIFPGLTVRENLEIGARMLPRVDRTPAFESVYQIFPVLGQRLQQQAGRLSGGEQQMLSLSRAFLVSPRLIIADELSLGLAPKMVDEVFASLARVKTSGVAVLLMEQFVHRALAFADQCLILRRGTCVWSGTAAGAKDEVLARYLGGGDAGASG